MKLAIVLLVAFGVVAAVSAMLLVQALMVPDSETQAEQAPVEPEVQVVVATRDLAAMAVLESDAVESRTVPQSDAPEEALNNPVQAVGKVLATPVVEGQALTRRSFVRDDSTAQLAASLPSGKRAVTVSLSDHAGLSGLLYPGSVVDVIATIRMEVEDASGTSEQAATTLLQGLQVLGVGGETVVSSNDENGRSGGGRSRLVALLVNPKQAQILRLAMAHGSVSLAMRNPSDAQADAEVTTWLSEIARVDTRPGRDQAQADALMIQQLQEALAEAQAERDRLVAEAGSESAAPPSRRWEVQIIRGNDSETLELTWPQETSEEQPAPAG